MKHAILGAGGIGGFIGAALARAGHDVTLIVRSPHHPRQIRLESKILGDFTAEVRTATTLPKGIDVLWVTVKSQQLEEALTAAPASELGDAQVVPLLNGVEHVARLREVYGRERVTPGVIGVESERVVPGVFRQLSPFARVELAGPRAAEIAAELATAGIPAVEAREEGAMLWRKLAGLASMALTTTSLQVPIGAVRADPVWLERMLAVAGETCATARAEGADVDVAAIREFILTVPDAMRSSMQKDRAAGNPIELDAIAGAVQRAGRRNGVPTPVIDELAAGLA